MALVRSIVEQTSNAHRYPIVPCIENTGVRSLVRWVFRLGVPNAAFDEAVTQGGNLGYRHLQEDLRGTGYRWLITQYRPDRIGLEFDVHPGQTLTIDSSSLRCDPVPLRVDRTNRSAVQHPILWRIYSRDARPIEGEIPYGEWSTY